MTARLTSWRRVVLGAVVALAAGGVLAAPAQAAQHQNAYYYSHWNFAGSSTGYWNVDQNMRVEKRAASTYWALLWNWVGSSDGGYMGLQTNGNTGTGTTGDTAIFSLWNANASSGPHCDTFSGEGTGLSCRLPYAWTTSPYYRFRVWRLNADAGGQWWGAWVQNTATGVDTYIGSLRVAATATAMTNVQNFVEYFGTQVACNKVPVSQAVWTQPAANSQGGGVYRFGSSYVAQPGDRGACTGGSATAVNLGSTKGVRVVLGG